MTVKQYAGNKSHTSEIQNAYKMLGKNTVSLSLQTRSKG